MNFKKHTTRCEKRITSFQEKIKRLTEKVAGLKKLEATKERKARIAKYIKRQDSYAKRIVARKARIAELQKLQKSASLKKAA